MRLAAFAFSSFGAQFFLNRHMQRAAAIFEKKYGADHAKTQESLMLVSAALRV
jgi:hypothetical protein